MTGSTRTRPSLPEQVAQLRRDVRKLQQRRVLAYVDDDPRPQFPDGIVVAGTPIGVVDPPPAASDLVLAWSAFFDVISIDASWTAAADATSYEIQLREHTGPNPGDRQLVDVKTTTGLAVRFVAVKPATSYDVRVIAIRTGVATPSAPLDATILTGSDASVPPAPTGLVVSAGIRSIVAVWDESVAEDVKLGRGLYEVDLSTSNTFDPLVAPVLTERTSSTIYARSDLGAIAGVTWYARVRAIDSSGNAGPNSATASSATAGVATDDVVTAGLSAAVIKFGAMSGDRISANSLDVDAIKTSTMTARVITLGAGGRIAVGTGSPGLFLDDLGLRLFNASAVRTFYLNGATGAVEMLGSLLSGSTITGTTITGGTVRTASSGARVQLDDNNRERIAFFNENGTLAGSLRRVNGLTSLEFLSDYLSLRNLANNDYSILYCLNAVASNIVSAADSCRAPILAAASGTTFVGTIASAQVTQINSGADGILIRTWPGGTGTEIYRSAASGKIVMTTTGVGTVDSRQGDTSSGSYAVMRASAFNVNSDSRAKRRVRPFDVPVATAFDSLVGALATWEIPPPKGRWHHKSREEQAAEIAEIGVDDEGNPLGDIEPMVWMPYAPGEAPETDAHRRPRRGFLADRLAPELLAEADPEYGAMIDVMATIATIAAKVSELDARIPAPGGPQR